MISINHTSFTVRNVEKTAKFYQGLGLTLIDLSPRDSAFAEKVTGVKGAKLKIAYLSAGNGLLELVEYVQGKGKKAHTHPNEAGSAHLCFDAEDFEATLRKLKDLGGEPLYPPATVPGGPNKGKKMCYARDCEGNLLEFFGR